MVAGRDAPIGVFDSGIGGLTVVKEIVLQLPNESVVYFGDTARVPYGPKSPDTVRRYSREIADYLQTQGVKAIVVACNTATAHALATLREALPIPVFGVVEPGARAAALATHNRRIGVIGTIGTIRSGAYERAIRAIMPDAAITVSAAPLLVPLIEEGWTEHATSRLVVEEYVRPFADAGIDTLVLGCTHYPLLRPLLAEVLGPGVALIDSAAETAAETARTLDDRQLSTTDGHRVAHRFIASDDPGQFLHLGQRFLGRTIEGVEIRTLG